MSRKPPGYWDDWKNVEEALRPVIERLGRFPTTSEVRALPGGSSIVDAIWRAGGFAATAQKFGAKRKDVRPDGYWKSWTNLERELRIVIAQLGHMPSRRELNSLGLSSLQQAIVDYHGGVTAVCDLMGIKPRERRNGYWKQWTNVRSAALHLIEQIGAFPPRAVYGAPENASLTNAMSRYHGGISAVRERLGFGATSTTTLRRYAEQIVELYMCNPRDAVSLEDFLAGLERECRYERDLRIRLGLPPEPESELATTETT